jgi:hypothetical protein
MREACPGGITWSDLTRCAIEMGLVSWCKEGFLRGKEQST